MSCLREKRAVNINLWISLLNIINVLIYSSFLMNACMVWADYEDTTKVKSKAFSVIMWIKLEFLIFIVNMFTIPGLMMILTISQWT